VKIEGVWGHEDAIERIVGSGIPVMGHIGLVPQSVHSLGGFKVQGREQSAAEDLVNQAKKLEELGCCSVVLECVPSSVAESITKAVSIPTIGIGAGVGADGQVLVLQDLLGMGSERKPKFVKEYLDGRKQVFEALNRFHAEVKAGSFPNETQSYT
jgi:3-methyl-2-oxobutanoate hydroxymethyltransferase